MGLLESGLSSIWSVSVLEDSSLKLRGSSLEDGSEIVSVDIAVSVLIWFAVGCGKP